jgi:hypothetical protein
MTTLDARARSAAHSINACVAEFTPAASFDVIAVRQTRWRTIQAGFAGVVAAVLVVVAGIAITQTPTPEVAEETVTTVVEPTVPQEPEIVTPIVTDTTEMAETTTTSEAPETTTTTTTTTVADTTPPPLTITAPEEGKHFEIDRIEFRGATEPGATVFTGKYQATVDAEGNWSIVLILSPGANGARFVATDPAGNQTEATVTVHYDLPETTTTTTTTTTSEPPKEEYEFTAYNVYGTCEEDPPYDVYWGTAPPGTPIYVKSEYGSGTTAANEHGEWEISVYFPEAPGGKEFTVKVKDDTGQKYLFGFKRLI